MAKEWTKTEAFAHFRTTLTNTRWSWSARTADGQTVVLALWSDRFLWKARPIEYHERADAVPQEWIARPGNQERLENLRWARSHTNGVFRVILVRAKDVNADPREIEECFPKDDLWMRISALNEATGQFSAVAADKP